MEEGPARCRFVLRQIKGRVEQKSEYHENQEYQRNHVARYADGNVVPVQNPPPKFSRVDLAGVRLMHAAVGRIR